MAAPPDHMKGRPRPSVLTMDFSDVEQDERHVLGLPSPGTNTAFQASPIHRAAPSPLHSASSTHSTPTAISPGPRGPMKKQASFNEAVHGTSPHGPRSTPPLRKQTSTGTLALPQPTSPVRGTFAVDGPPAPPLAKKQPSAERISVGKKSPAPPHLTIAEPSPRADTAQEFAYPPAVKRAPSADNVFAHRKAPPPAAHSAEPTARTPMAGGGGPPMLKRQGPTGEGLLRHPRTAQLADGGVTPTGRVASGAFTVPPNLKKQPSSDAVRRTSDADHPAGRVASGAFTVPPNLKKQPSSEAVRRSSDADHQAPPPRTPAPQTFVPKPVKKQPSADAILSGNRHSPILEEGEHDGKLGPPPLQRKQHSADNVFEGAPSRSTSRSPGTFTPPPMKRQASVDNVDGAPSRSNSRAPGTFVPPPMRRQASVDNALEGAPSRSNSRAPGTFVPPPVRKQTSMGILSSGVESELRPRSGSGTLDTHGHLSPTNNFGATLMMPGQQVSPAKRSPVAPPTPAAGGSRRNSIQLSHPGAAAMHGQHSVADHWTAGVAGEHQSRRNSVQMHPMPGGSRRNSILMDPAHMAQYSSRRPSNFPSRRPSIDEGIVSQRDVSSRHMGPGGKPLVKDHANAALDVNLRRQGLDRAALDKAIVQEVIGDVIPEEEAVEKPRRTAEEDRLATLRATYYIKDALKLRTPKRHGTGPWATLLFKMQEKTVYQFFMILVVLGNMFVAWGEPTMTSVSKSTTSVYTAEFFFLIVLGLDMLAEIVHAGWDSFYAIDPYEAALNEKRPQTWFVKIDFLLSGVTWTFMNAILVSLILIDAIASAIAPPYFRVSRLLRSLLLFRNQAVRKAAMIQVRAMKLLWVPIFILVFTLIFFAIITTELISDLARDINSTTGLTGYGSVGESILSFFVLLTMDNWPFTWYPIYQKQPVLMLIFLIFVLTSFYLLLAVITAVEFDGFRESRAGQGIRDRVTERRALLAAFQELDDGKTGHVSRDMMCAVLRALGVERDVEVQFDLIDQDRSGTVEILEFFQLCDVLLVHVEDDEVPVALSRFWCQPHPKFRKVVGNEKFPRFILFLVFLSAICEALLPGVRPNSEAWTALFTIDYMILAFFLIEMWMKSMAYGAAAFWHDAWCRYDATMIGLSLLFSLFPPGGVATLGQINFSVFRCIKLLRFISQVPTLRKFTQTFFGVYVPVVMVAALIIIVSYIYGIFGMEVFSDKLTIDPVFTAANPYANFASAGDTFLALLQVMVLANWSPIMYAAITATDRSAALFFCSYIVIVAVLLLNLLTSLVLEMFYIARESGQLDGDDGIPLIMTATKEVEGYDTDDDFDSQEFDNCDEPLPPEHYAQDDLEAAARFLQQETDDNASPLGPNMDDWDAPSPTTAAGGGETGGNPAPMVAHPAPPSAGLADITEYDSKDSARGTPVLDDTGSTKLNDSGSLLAFPAAVSTTPPAPTAGSPPATTGATNAAGTGATQGGAQVVGLGLAVDRVTPVMVARSFTEGSAAPLSHSVSGGNLASMAAGLATPGSAGSQHSAVSLPAGESTPLTPLETRHPSMPRLPLERMIAAGTPGSAGNASGGSTGSAPGGALSRSESMRTGPGRRDHNNSSGTLDPHGSFSQRPGGAKKSPRVQPKIKMEKQSYSNYRRFAGEADATIASLEQTILKKEGVDEAELNKLNTTQTLFSVANQLMARDRKGSMAPRPSIADINNPEGSLSPRLDGANKDGRISPRPPMREDTPPAGGSSAGATPGATPATGRATQPRHSMRLHDAAVRTLAQLHDSPHAATVGAAAVPGTTDVSPVTSPPITRSVSPNPAAGTAGGAAPAPVVGVPVVGRPLSRTNTPPANANAAAVAATSTAPAPAPASSAPSATGATATVSPRSESGQTMVNSSSSGTLPASTPTGAATASTPTGGGGGGPGLFAPVVTPRRGSNTPQLGPALGPLLAGTAVAGMHSTVMALNGSAASIAMTSLNGSGASVDLNHKPTA